MGYAEAIQDNIPMEKHDGFGWYFPPCRICGSPVSTWSYIRGTEYTCADCKKLLIEEHVKNKKVLQVDKKQKKFDTAIKRISKVTDIAKYKKALEIVQKNLYKAGWFQSTEEIMTAVELIKRGLKINHQVSVYEYSVDFIIPEFKVALEIDGRPFHTKDNEKAQTIRDEVIADKLGEGWNVIRIDTENINTNVTKLVPAIKRILKYREDKKSAV